MGETFKINSKSGKYYKGGKGGSHVVGELCPSCVSTDRIKEKGKLVERKNRTNNTSFLGCSRYPECKYTYSMANLTRPTTVNFEKIKPKSDCTLCHGSGVDNYSFDEPRSCFCVFREIDLTQAKSNCETCEGSGVDYSNPSEPCPCFCTS